MKDRGSLFIRIPVFMAGILISSFGVALSAKANLGITPISSPPYVLSLLTPLTMGTITTITHVIFIAAQILILRKNYKPKDLLQLVLALVYGRVMDFSTWLLRDLSPTSYPERLGLCFLSICVIAFGVYLTVAADIMFLAGEGLVSAISKTTGKEFGRIKIIVDSSLLVFAAAVSLIFLHRLEGIREGTFIAAVAVGLLVQLYGKIFSRFTKSAVSAEEQALSEAAHLVVTIAREFDPKSMEIVKRLSEITGLKLYDDELIEMIAEESGLSVEFVKKSEDRFRKGILRSFYEQSFEFPYQYGGDDDRMYEAQKRVILKLAAHSDCIIIGRNANKALGRGPRFFHIFLHAKPLRRAERTAERFHINQKQAESVIARADEQRRRYYYEHLGRSWGRADDYNLCLDITHGDVEKTAVFLKTAIEDFTWKGTGESV